jgi:hypothetical protein
MAPDDVRLRKWLSLLESMGAMEVAHIEDNLGAHLTATYDILARWGCSDDLCAAGLFHSVYSTDHLETQTIPLSERPRVAEAIGDKAEKLAFLYCSIDRGSLYENLNRRSDYSVRDRWNSHDIPLQPEELAELLTLDSANTLELLPKGQWSPKQRADARRVHARALPLLPPKAAEELSSALEVGRLDVALERARSLLARMPLFRRLKQVLVRRLFDVSTLSLSSAAFESLC